MSHRSQPPERIYLQCHDEDGNLLDLVHDDVTWCVDKINANDVTYIIDEAEKKKRPRTAFAFEEEE